MDKRSYGNIICFILMKKGGLTNVWPMAMRKNATLDITSDTIALEKNLQLENYTKFEASCESYKVPFELLKDIFEQYLPDGMINAQLITSAQQAALDGRGMKGNEVFNFGWSPNGNGYAGLKIAYKEEYTGNVMETSLTPTLLLRIEKFEADLFLATAKTNVGSVDADPIDVTKKDPGIIYSILYNGNTLFEKNIIHSYKMTMDIAGSDDSMYGRPQPDEANFNIEIVSKLDSSYEKVMELRAVNQFAPLIITKKLAANLLQVWEFKQQALSKVVDWKISDKRFATAKFTGNVNINNVTFSTVVDGGITYKKIIIG